MKKNSLLLIVILLSVPHLIFSQKFSDKRTYQIVEPILNAVINSEVFDTVYHSNKVYFLINDLIPEDKPWRLFKNGHKVKYITEKQKKKVKQYFVLGDFTLDWEDPENSWVRVQLSLVPAGITLGFGLTRINEKWVIKVHIIIYPDY